LALAGAYSRCQFEAVELLLALAVINDGFKPFK